MNKNLIKWLIGTALIGIIGFVIIKYPPQILFYQNLPFILFLRRAFFILLLSFVFGFYRLLKGPSAVDRVAAFYVIGMLITGFCALINISTGRSWYIDIAIAWFIQNFIWALAFAKSLEGRDFDE